MNSNMILNDIMEQWNTEDNFEFCFGRYFNHLEREGKWKFCENNSTKNNFKYRMRKQYNGDIDRSREYTKFENWVEKMKISEQKEVERRAIKLDQQWKNKYEKLLEEYETLKKQNESLKKDYHELLEKYIKECDSDSDDEPIEKIEY